MMNRTLVALALASFTTATAAQQTIVVPDDYPTLGLALNPGVSGLAPGDTIELRDTVVYAGTFTITTPGITIREAAGDTVVLDAFGTGSVFTIDAPGEAVTFEGLTMQNGDNRPSNGGAINVIDSNGIIARNCEFLNNQGNAGGAVYALNTTNHFENCAFTGNSSTVFGGALRTTGDSLRSTTITGSTFTSNTALGGNGGAIDHAGSGAALTIVGSLFDQNTCTSSGGAVFVTSSDSVIVESTTLTDNIALGTDSQDTGGIFLTGVDDVTIRGCEFERNLCAGSGGALRFTNSSGDVIDCRFIENEASSGGAMQVVGGSNAEIYNSVFIGNSALREGSENGFGGAILVNSTNTTEATTTIYNSLFDANFAINAGAINASTESNVFPLNCTFVNNVITGTIGSAIRRSSTTSDVIIDNAIVFGNTPSDSQIAISGGGLDEVNFSLVEGGYAGVGTGNIDANPMFVDPSNGDYALSPNSPAIDAGSSARYIGGPLSDLAGNDRGQDDPDTPDTGEAIIGAVIDMGAYEFTDDSGIPDCPADQNFDGILTPGDFTAWINNYNQGC